jgi:hypothetical protein
MAGKNTFIIVAIAALMTSCSGSELSGPGSSSFVQINGQVFATFVGPGTSNYGAPVAGAVVSTSLDSSTTTSDVNGNFQLITATPKSTLTGCSSYTIVITSAGLPTFRVTGAWGTGGTPGTTQKFVLSPPTPSFVGCECPNPPAACHP